MASLSCIILAKDVAIAKTLSIYNLSDKPSDIYLTSIIF